MSRNRSVSSAAISRAVQEASGADFGSAADTLVTAITLIRQSKVAADERCKILVSSLQDTLHGIESRSRHRLRHRHRHGGDGGSRSRSRSAGDLSGSRGHSADRTPSSSYHQLECCYRDRSRSREREYHR